MNYKRSQYNRKWLIKWKVPNTRSTAITKFGNYKKYQNYEVSMQRGKRDGERKMDRK